MRDHSQPPHVCSIDPISAVVGGIIPGLFGGGGKQPAAPTPEAPPPQAAPATKPQGKQNTQQPTFMGAIPTPPPSTGNKTLLGQ